MYQVIYPKSEILKKHIISFNILEGGNDFEKLTYLVFPQKGATIGIFKNADIEAEQTNINLKASSSGVSYGFLGKYLVPLELTYHHFIKEIGINFTATGINYFFDNYFTELAPNEIQILPKNQSPLQIEGLFDDSELIIEKLEKALLAQYSPLDLVPIEKAVEFIQNDPAIQTKDLAKEVFLTEKTLNRNFQKYVGCTTTQYRKICKFRDSVNDFFQNKSEKTLTQICLDNFYYDSAHFHKEFNKIASFNPKDFFKKVSNIGKDDYPYIFS